MEKKERVVFFSWAHSSWMEFLTYAAGMQGMQDSLIQTRRKRRRIREEEKRSKKDRTDQSRPEKTRVCVCVLGGGRKQSGSNG